MKNINYCVIEGKSVGFFAGIAVSGLITLLGLWAAYNMEHHGHVITGMTNQIVWGMPHIFAIFLILAASGVLNVASISSVFRKSLYKPFARLSVLLAITLLLGGLSVLLLDLGRPDRLLVAMTSYNFKSIFAWNIILYNGFLAICIIYLWFMMERRLQRYYPTVGLIAFVWRLILTTGTGSIFGFLVSREAFHTAIMAPLFIALSLGLGLAIFLIVLLIDCVGKQCSMDVLERPKQLLGVFIASVFYFVMVYHLSHLYFTGRHGIESFFLVGGGIYTTLFWGGYILLGTILPLLVLYQNKLMNNTISIATASLLTIIGGFALLYVIIIGGQAYPIDIFPGMEVMNSGFFDKPENGLPGHLYIPSGWEIMLGFAGIGISALLTIVAVKVLPLMPCSIGDVESNNKD